jgi:acetyl-CoA decarbonylase/synthase complex subunit gamma
MALSGLEIYKLLPKTNCKECGFPTCLAFAMKLAAKQAELSACPYVSADAKQALEAASAPPIRLVTLGGAEHKVEVGNETVMFRHEKTFFHQPGGFIRVADTLPAAELNAKLDEILNFKTERVGVELFVDGIAIQNASGSPDTFAQTVAAVRAKTKRPLILLSDNPAAIAAGLAKEGGMAPLVGPATPANWQEMAKVAKEGKASLIVKGAGNLSALAELAEQVKAAGLENIVLDPGERSLAGSLAMFTQLRRLALKKNFRPLGYPIIAFPGEGAESFEEEVVAATQAIAKYAGIVVMDHFDPAVAYILLTLRLNIYTDPQKPIQVSPGVYEFNAPKPESPLLVTTNFSLTYFSVAGEVEASGLPAWVLITDAEGMSVLTAWAAGKFDAERIAKSTKTFNVPDKINHKKIVIPGLVATISGELEEELPGWDIRVGPREAVDIPSYLKNVWK